MAITVGTDTYVTLAEFKTYLGKKYGVDTVIALSDADLEKLLVCACNNIELLQFDSAWDVTNQTLKFPRLYEDKVSNNVKLAQMEEAISLKLDSGVTNNRIANGIKSVSIDGASETYVDRDTFSVLGLASRRAYTLLQSYILKAMTMG